MVAAIPKHDASQSVDAKFASMGSSPCPKYFLDGRLAEGGVGGESLAEPGIAGAKFSQSAEGHHCPHDGIRIGFDHRDGIVLVKIAIEQKPWPLAALVVKAVEAPISSD